MPENIPFFRVFVSSPGDVNDERKAVLEILERLPNRPAFREKVGFRVVAWDKPGADTPMLASMSPQEAIDAGLPKPSQCDIVVVILWSRMGTPFMMNESNYMSGTHYELMDALGGDRTEVLIYQRTEKKYFEAYDKTGQEEYERVQAFFNSSLFYDPNTKQIRRGKNVYTTPSDFREKFETHIEDLVLRMLGRATRPIPVVEIPPVVPQGTVITFEPKRWVGSPFPGLRAFTESDSLIFFGRDKETDALVKRVAENRFVVIVGASGSGKSSLVGAGLIPRLRANAISNENTGSKDWIFTRLTPGENPFAALFDVINETFPAIRPSAFEMRRVKQQFIQDLISDPATLSDTLDAALMTVNAPPWAEVVFFIDQFEELFTQTPPEMHVPFINLVVGLGTNHRVRVVATLRADFYHRAVEHAAFTPLLEQGSFPLSAPTTTALYQMIVHPAEQAGLDFEEGLVERILQDTGSDAGALALMAYALDELYKIAEANKTDDLCISHKDYESLQGVQGAIGARAEAVFNKLSPEAQAIFGRAFTRLVTIDENGTATRLRAKVVFDDLSSALQELTNRFIQARLITIDRDHDEVVIEVAHEALFRNWERLRDWIDRSQSNLRLQKKISADTTQWFYKNKPEALLYRGSILHEAQGWAAENLPTAGEQAFLEASAVYEAQEIARLERLTTEAREATQQSEAAAKRAKRSRTLAVVVGGIALVGVLLSVFLVSANVQTLNETYATSTQVVVEQEEVMAIFFDALQPGKDRDSRLIAVNQLTEGDQRYRYQLLGLVHNQLGEYKFAIDAYTQLIEIYVDSQEERANAYVNRGIAKRNLDDFVAAIEDFTQAISLNPEHPSSAAAYYQRGKTFEEIQRNGYTILSSTPTPIPFDIELFQPTPASDQYRYYMLALEDYSKAIELDHDYTDAYFGRVTVNESMGKYEEVLEDYNQLIELNPDSSNLYINRSRFYDYLGKPDLVIADYNKAIELSPNDPYYYSYRARLYESRGEYALAAEDYSKLLEFNPDDVNYYINRGWMYYLVDDYQLALADFEVAVGLDSQSQPAIYNRAVTNMRLNKAEIAFEDFKRGVEIDPMSYSTEYAINDLNSAIAEEENNPLFYLFRGYLHYHRQNVEVARADWESVETLGGTFLDEIQSLWDALKNSTP